MGSLLPPIQFNLIRFLIKFPIWVLLIIPIIFFSCAILPWLLNWLYDWIASTMWVMGPIGIFFGIWALVAIITIPLFIPVILFAIFANAVADLIFVIITAVLTSIGATGFGFFTASFLQFFNMSGAIISKFVLIFGTIALWIIITLIITIAMFILVFLTGMTLLPVILIGGKILLFFGSLLLTFGIGPLLSIFTCLGTVFSVDLEKWLNGLWEDFKIPLMIMGLFICVMTVILTIAIVVLFAGPLFGKIKQSMASAKLQDQAKKAASLQKNVNKRIENTEKALQNVKQTANSGVPQLG